MRSRTTSNVGPARPAPAAGKQSRGKVKRLTRGEGSGIISAARGDVFFHKSDFQGKFFDLNVGDQVTFDLLDDSISGPRAQNVRPVGAKKTAK
jgi:cold shock CspA family protein